MRVCLYVCPPPPVCQQCIVDGVPIALHEGFVDGLSQHCQLHLVLSIIKLLIVQQTYEGGGWWWGWWGWW